MKITKKTIKKDFPKIKEENKNFEIVSVRNTAIGMVVTLVTERKIECFYNQTFKPICWR